MLALEDSLELAGFQVSADTQEKAWEARAGPGVPRRDTPALKSGEFHETRFHDEFPEMEFSTCGGLPQGSRASGIAPACQKAWVYASATCPEAPGTWKNANFEAPQSGLTT